MSFLFVILYGLLTGFFDVLPVSSFAHQSALKSIFGVGESLHLYDLLVHLASLAALVFATRPTITALMREQRVANMPRRRKQGDRKVTYELRFVKVALISVVISTILFLLLRDYTNNDLLIGILCIVNGAVILVPEYLPSGNKTGKHMSRLDAMLFGVMGGLGAFCGVSRVATMQSYASLRGVDRAKACTWTLLATISALVILIFFDIFGMFSAGVESISFLKFLSYLLGMALSFIGTFAGVTLARFLSAKVGFVGFGYYSIGAGLFTFFLYLTV